jgi:MGT family glycosyltransferase
MARLLFTVWPHLTHLRPFVALGQAARARGHDVVFYTGGDGLALLAREGFRCFPFQEVNWGAVAQMIDELIARRNQPFHLRGLWPRFLVDTVPAQVHDLEAVLTQWPADALICDIAMWAPILILHERNGIPVAPFSHVANCILPGPDGAVQGIDLPRSRNAVQNLLAGAASLVVHLVTGLTRTRANAMRLRFGLSPLRVSVNEFTATMPLYLVPSTPQFDHSRRDLPPSVRYVGPCLWHARQGETAAAWLREVPSNRPCVVVDEGALFTREPLVLELAARGLAGLPVSVVLVAGYGRDLARLNLGPLASNMILQPHAALSDALRLAQVLVTNGNSESVLAALEAGVPLVVLPSIWDQADSAWTVQQTGIGLRLSPRRVTPETMRRAAERVLNEPSFRQNALATGAELARYGGPSYAVRLIEEMLRSR